MSKPTANPNQLALGFFIPSVTIPQGDGSVLVKPGKPVEWMSTKLFAKQFEKSPKTICGWLHDGTIPEFLVVDGKRVQVVKRMGKKALGFNAILVGYMQAKFDAEGGIET